MLRVVGIRSIRSMLVAVMVAGVAVLLGHAPAWAATIQVTTATDENGSGGSCSLREAVTAANTDAAFGGCPAGSGDDRITFANAANGITNLGGTEITITSNVQIVGNGAANTVLEGNWVNRPPVSRIFLVDGTVTVRISGVTIQGASGNTGPDRGGGIYNNGGTLTVDDSVIRDNDEVSGAGIYSNGTLTVIGSTFSTNSGGSGGGGGIFNDGGTLSVFTTIFQQNDASVGGGGGIRTIGGTVAVTDSTFSGNTTRNGGAGAGIRNDGGTLTVTNTTFGNNEVEDGGFNAFGGGIYNGGTAIITNVTLSGNTSPNEGGGFYNGGTATLTHVTFSGNSAGDEGDSITNIGTLRLRASVLDNAGDVGHCSGTAVTTQGSNIADDGTCFANAGTDKVVADGAILLGPLANNGGPTQTHALLKNSPAIDIVQGGCAVGNDQRGIARPQGSTCDAGAFEFEVPAGNHGGGDDSTNRNGRNDRGTKAKETQEQQQQRERTNASNRDDYATEGNVVEVHPDAAPPYVVIANRDGLVKVVLFGDAARYAGSIRVGDYLQAEGEKQHEQLYEATDISVKRGR